MLEEVVNGQRVAEIPPDVVRQQVSRMLRSKTFTTSPRLSRFLEFSVEQTLLGRQSTLKEYIIGVEVFERTESFDPRVDAIVRVEARRLRAKVDQYYSHEGARDQVVVYYERGSYSPRLLRREEADSMLHALVPSSIQKPAPDSHIRQLPVVSNPEKVERWLRYVLQATQTALWNLDTDTGALVWSAEACAVFGGKAPAGNLSLFLDSVHADDRLMVRELVDAAKSQGNEFEARFRINGFGTHPRFVSMKGTTIGLPCQVIGIVRQAESD